MISTEAPWSLMYNLREKKIILNTYQVKTCLSMKKIDSEVGPAQI